MTLRLQNLRRASYKIFVAAVLVVIMLMPRLASAADDVSEIDARLEGYVPSVVLKDASGTGMTIFLLVVLMGMTMGVMFINANRSHLD